MTYESERIEISERWEAIIRPLVEAVTFRKEALDVLTSVPERDIEAIKVVSKAFKESEKEYKETYAKFEKEYESKRRDQLKSIGCNPDNHPATHTVERHLIIKKELLEKALKGL